VIALLGAVGGAAYMTACRELMPVGINPIILSLTINIGMATTTFILCLLTLPNGISFFSTNVQNGFFGFLNPVAARAAFLHSIFPDMFGNFGAMIALSYFEPLIVSMVFLTEPLNASIIAMNFVGEAPPSRRTIVGVAIGRSMCDHEFRFTKHHTRSSLHLMLLQF
jgi:drug/metabolite transporter (DMT)-like permease